MSAHTALLGLYQPQDGWLFKLAPGWKYLILLGITVPALIAWKWWFTLAALVVALAILRSSGITMRRALNIGAMLWLLLAILAGFQIVTLRFEQAIISPGNVLVAVLCARILTLTTSTPDLLDALTSGLRGFRLVGIDPARVSLAVAVMVRSIPYLLGSLSDARDAARARGMERSLFSLLIPAMVNAVAYAQRTGEAIHARGLESTTSPPDPASGK